MPRSQKCQTLKQIRYRHICTGHLASSSSYSSSLPLPSSTICYRVDCNDDDADSGGGHNIHLQDSSSGRRNNQKKENCTEAIARILIADDDEDIAKVFKTGLELKGFEVDAFTDPSEALKNFKPGYYNSIISDIRMPKMNGFQLCKELLRIDNKIKIFFVSAVDINADEFRAQFPCVNYKHFIDKPVSIAKIAEIIMEPED